MNDTPQTEGRRSLGPWLLVFGLLIGFAAGFLISGLLSGNEPSDPALAYAQEWGMALPDEQQEAFFDGEITSSEREEAADRFRQCVEDAGITDFLLELTEGGHSISVGDHSSDVELCNLRHFKATNFVYTGQNRPGSD